jgi:hypothetical protein
MRLAELIFRKMIEEQELSYMFNHLQKRGRNLYGQFIVKQTNIPEYLYMEYEGNGQYFFCGGDSSKNFDSSGVSRIESALVVMENIATLKQENNK